MPMDYHSQIDLPVAADHDKSPIRKQELDQHSNGECHIQNDGQPNQMLVMTSMGPRMMFPKLNCMCGSHYGCDCRIVFDDDPPISGNPRDVIQVACGLTSSYFLLRNGEVWSCGNNASGQLGRIVMNGHWQTMNLGRIMGLPSSVIHITATDASFFALLDNGDVWCCGNNDSGQLGYLQMTGTATTPILLKHPNLANVKRIACGKDFAYFLLQDGTVRNCGNNNLSQLGRLAPSGTSVTPNLGLFPLSGVKRIACGDATTYVQIGDHEIWTCGQNSSSQCGFAYDGSSIATPRLAYTAPGGIRMISCGTRHGLIVLNNGKLLGTGYPGQYAYPMSGSGFQTFTETGLQVTSGIPANATFAVAGDELSWVRADQQLLRGGNNVQGQLLPGAPTPSSGWGIFNLYPFDQNADNIVSVRSRSSFMIQADGNVFALGDNTFGQLGCKSAVQIGGYGTLDFH